MTTVKELIEDLQKDFKPEDELWVTYFNYSEFAEELKEDYGVTLPLDVWKEAIDKAPTGDDIMGIQGVISEMIEKQLKKRGIKLVEVEA
jgi:hypothetical protein